MNEDDDFYGIYSTELLGLTHPCSERNCAGRMASTGFLRFNRHFVPERAWALEFECPVCHAGAMITRKGDLPLVQKLLRPIVEG